MKISDILPSPERMRVILVRDPAAAICEARARIAKENTFIAELETEERIRTETARQLASAGMDAKTATIADLMRIREAAEQTIATEIPC